MLMPPQEIEFAAPPAGAMPTITFTCLARDEGVIAAPVPARTMLPDWFRRLPAIDSAHLSTSNNGLTVKRCMPFFDALATGWILPLAATVRLEVSCGGRTVLAGWEFDRTMVSNHSPPQVAGHPLQPRPPCKFHNHWTIRTAPGWSCLFLPPLNRPNGVFECVAGIVDTDTYASPVHLPFFATGPDGLHVLERGTPLVQIIPFRRDDASPPGEIRSETKEEAEARERILRQTLASDGWYRREARAER